LSNPNALCNNNGQLNLTTLYVPGTPTGGTWSILSAPGGGNPAVINGNAFNASNADAGVYQLQYTISGFPGNCPDSDVVSITVNPEPDAGLAIAPAQVCVGDDSLLVLNQLISGADAGGVWMETSVNPSTGGAFNASNGTFRSGGQNSGTYTFQYLVSGSPPCPNASTTVEVVVENLPSADAGADDALTCEKTSIVLGGSGTSTGPEFTYLWTTVGGTLMNPTSLNATATKTGTYTLTVRNTVTGCESSDQIVVTQEGDIPSDLNLNVLSPQCVGDPPGSAQVVSVVGGTPPYVYSFNGAPSSATSSWSNLTAGDYTVVVTDDLGCKYETNFSIGTANDIDGTLAGDAIVELGDPATFTYDLSVGVADSTVWLVDGTPICFDCDSVFVFTPTRRAEVEVRIYDERGCELILSAFIQVKVTRNVYVPNVFSPNGDGTNDFFTIFASNSVVDKIEYMQIFSRWGEKVLEPTNIPPAVESRGWDGTFAGEELNPGVYVYHAKVIYVDGVEEIFKGDITLLR
jgi:gliding motility-associated-like protein